MTESANTNRPPGRRTRKHSLKTRPFFVERMITLLLMTTSTLASGIYEHIIAMLCCYRDTRPVGPTGRDSLHYGVTVVADLQVARSGEPLRVRQLSVPDPPLGRTAIYGRVAGVDQRPELERQAARLTALGECTRSPGR